MQSVWIYSGFLTGNAQQTSTYLRWVGQANETQGTPWGVEVNKETVIPTPPDQQHECSTTALDPLIA